MVQKYIYIDNSLLGVKIIVLSRALKRKKELLDEECEMFEYATALRFVKEEFLL